jgi:hypothetical protein
MAKRSQRIKARKAKGSRQSLNQAKKASLALRTSFALAHATPLFVDLHKRIQEFVLKDFSQVSNDVELNAPLPGPIQKSEPVMELLVHSFETAIANDSSWGVDPNKFTLTGKELYNQAQNNHTVSYLIQFIYQRAHDALRV